MQIYKLRYVTLSGAFWGDTLNNDENRLKKDDWVLSSHALPLYQMLKKDIMIGRGRRGRVKAVRLFLITACRGLFWTKWESYCINLDH